VTTTHDPLDFICGDSWPLAGPLEDADCNPLVLVGASISWRLDSIDGLTNYLALSVGSGIQIVSNTTAMILVTVSAAQTANLAPGNYKDSLRVTLADGSVFTEWTGYIRAAANPN
jgi:hypothetical protein